MKNRKVKHQKGQIFRAGKSWYGRWRRDELETTADGLKVVVRRQHAEKLCEYGNRYRCKRDVQPLLDEKLRPLNENRCTPEGTLSIAAYGDEFFFPHVERELKPSTICGYRGLWRMYLRPRLANVVLRDFRCVDATSILAAVHEAHGLSRKSLRHCKALMSTIFTFAKQRGVLDGPNPITDAGIPRGAGAGTPTYAYSAQEVLAMLNTLAGVARTAVALMYFCGLRPGEARAARWDDYDADKRTLRVRASMWRKFLTTPKTEESCAVVPVAEVLANVLSEMPRTSQFILAGPSGKPIDLHNLASRVVVPGLERCTICRELKSEHNKTTPHVFDRDKSLPAWQGWYALRRGLATIATAVDSPLAAKSLLRHSNIQTTAAHYIKSIPAEALRAVQKVDALFETGVTNAVN